MLIRILQFQWQNSAKNVFHFILKRIQRNKQCITEFHPLIYCCCL